MTDEAKALVEWLRSVRSPQAGQAADLIETQAREIERLREALGEICTDSNPDWTEKRVYPNDALDDIHTISVNAYYKVNL